MCAVCLLPGTVLGNIVKMLLLSYEHSCGFYICALKVSKGLYSGQIIECVQNTEMPLQMFCVTMFKCIVYKMLITCSANKM